MYIIKEYYSDIMPLEYKKEKRYIIIDSEGYDMLGVHLSYNEALQELESLKKSFEIFIYDFQGVIDSKIVKCFNREEAHKIAKSIFNSQGLYWSKGLKYKIRISK